MTKQVKDDSNSAPGTISFMNNIAKLTFWGEGEYADDFWIVVRQYAQIRSDRIPKILVNVLRLAHKGDVEFSVEHAEKIDFREAYKFANRDLALQVLRRVQRAMPKNTTEKEKFYVIHVRAKYQCEDLDMNGVGSEVEQVLSKLTPEEQAVLRTHWRDS